MIYNKKLYNNLIKNFADKGFEYIKELDSQNFQDDEYLLDVLLAGGKLIDAKSIYTKNVMLAGRNFHELSFEEKLEISTKMREVQIEERKIFLEYVSDKLRECQSVDEKK